MGACPSVLGFLAALARADKLAGRCFRRCVSTTSLRQGSMGAIPLSSLYRQLTGKAASTECRAVNKARLVAALVSRAILEDLELESRTDGAGEKEEPTMEELVSVSTSITD